MENSVNGLESMAQTAVESRSNTFTPIVDDLSFATAKIVMDGGIGISEAAAFTLRFSLLAATHMEGKNTMSKLQFFNDSMMYFDDGLEIRFKLYTIFGIMVCVASALCILVFSTKELRLNYMMYLALSLGDLINGASYVAAGLFRNSLIYNGQFFETTTGMECLFETPFAILLLIAGQYPALINLFIAMERIAALQFSAWYRVFWREHNKIYLILVASLLTFVSGQSP
ncbi:unnamed protein product [Nippostrongylus brasiliensis]|uniref:G protein-coupled receptor n=1 Tax=Nippostrongylus brasiliensis TaxID=27835 RepID=A0A0N4YKR7_NIPBR|nr:unnamed protein product [Nippostrongylus brasiliensis]